MWNQLRKPIIKLGVQLGWRLQEVIGQPRLLKRSGQISPYRWEWHSKWGRNWDVRPATCYVRQCWITQLSKVRWIFGGWRLCPSGRLCAHRSVQIHFFQPSKKQHTVEKGVIQNSGRTQLSKVRLFFLSWFFSFSTVCWNGFLYGRPEKNTVTCGPRPKKK